MVALPEVTETKLPPASTKDGSTDRSSQTLTAPPSIQTTLAPLDEQESPREYDPSIGAKPYSPFYRHISADRVEPRRSIRGIPSLSDLERGVRIHHDPSQDTRRPCSSKLWEEQRSRCVWWRRMGKKKRLTIKICIAIVILGTMIAVTLGITAGVGG